MAGLDIFKKIPARLKKALLLFLITFLVLLSITCALVATQSGSRWVVMKAANSAGLKIQQLNGSLLLGLDATGVDFQSPTVQVHVDKLSFRWQPLAVFYSTVSVQSLAAENIFVNLPADNQKPPAEFHWPNLSMPLPLEFDSLDLRELRIDQGSQHFSVTSIHGGLVLGKFHWRATDLNLANPAVGILVNGDIATSHPYKSHLKIRWKYQNAQDGLVYAGDGELNGNIKRFQLDHKLAQPFSLKTVAKIAPAIQEKNPKPQADIALDWNGQALTDEFKKQLDPNAQISILQNIKSTKGHLQAQGWLDQLKLSGKVQIDTSDANITAEINAQGRSNFASGKDGAPRELSFHVDKLQVDVRPPAVVSAQKGVQQIIQAPVLSPEPLVTQLHKENVAENALRSKLSVSGDLRILPTLQWDMELAGEHINLAQFMQQWPSDLQIHLNTRGEFDGERLIRLAMQQINVQGILRTRKVNAQGDLLFDNNHWQSPGLNASVGDNQLSLKGQASNQLALEWNLNAPSLNQLDPGLRGKLVSSGLLSGNIDNPRVQINAQANDLAYGSYAAKNVLLKINPLAANNQYQLQIDGDDLQLQQQIINSISITGEGNVQQHTLKGQLQSPAYGLVEFVLGSGWRDHQWRGQWRSLSVSRAKLPRWYMISSSPMQIDKARADLGKLCMSTANDLPEQVETPGSHSLQEIPSLCVTSLWEAKQGFSADVNLKAGPLNGLRAWFKPEVTLAGVLDADAKVRIPTSGTLSVDANVQTRNATLSYQFQSGKLETYPLAKGKATLAIKNNMLTANALLDWANYGTVTGDVKYNLADKKIQAKAVAKLPNLAPVEGLLPFLDNVQGAANGNLAWVGTLDKPEITGSFTLTNGSANLPKLGLELKDISLQITSPSINSAHVEGKVTSGEGTLVTQGDFINLGAPDWHWQANVFGADIRIITQTQLTANISPNLKLYADAKSIELTGSTEIPWARANVKSLPESATRVSHDVVIVEKDNVSAASIEKKSIPFHTNVILYFGDDVRFKGFGLDTRLSGKANVIKEENRQLFTTGFVAVDRGIYKAYGQELTIERGRLIFQGPYDNPGLDIRAVRIINDTESAGLDIGGTLQRPKSTVFAIPAKPDSEAMAILLTGKSLTQSSKDDAYAILGAIGKLGLSQGESTSADIIHKVGLDEVSVKADKGLEQSQLWLGKYLTPRLFVHYVVGLFDQAFSLGITYKISDKIQVEAESGKTQSVDVIYRIER